MSSILLIAQPLPFDSTQRWQGSAKAMSLFVQLDIVTKIVWETDCCSLVLCPLMVWCEVPTNKQLRSAINDDHPQRAVRFHTGTMRYQWDSLLRQRLHRLLLHIEVIFLYHYQSISNPFLSWDSPTCFEYYYPGDRGCRIRWRSTEYLVRFIMISLSQIMDILLI